MTGHRPPGDCRILLNAQCAQQNVIVLLFDTRQGKSIQETSAFPEHGELQMTLL